MIRNPIYRDEKNCGGASFGHPAMRNQNFASRNPAPGSRDPCGASKFRRPPTRLNPCLAIDVAPAGVRP